VDIKKLLRTYSFFLRDFLRDLFDDKLGHYASSLSWSTLFSIIPLLVIMLWVFTQMPLFDSVYEKMQSLLYSNLMPTNSKEILSYINTFIDNADQLGYVGFFYVLFTAVMFFKNYDYIVNDIFSSPSRGITQALKFYLLLILVISTLLAFSVYLSSVTTLSYLLVLVPYLVVWMVFYLAYQLSATVHIEISAALVSSFIASLVWYLSKSAFVFYVLHNKTYASIYGGISTFLFFFLWIYISWAIFIHGLKLCALLNKHEEKESID